MNGRRHVYTIPTELGRWPKEIVKVAVIAVILTTAWLGNMGVPLWTVSLPAVAGVLFFATTESASDISGFGRVSSWLRARLGYRRADQWVLAFAHYVNLVHVPRWKFHSRAYWRYLRRQTTRSRRTLSGRIRWKVLPAYSRACSFRFNWSARRGR